MYSHSSSETSAPTFNYQNRDFKVILDSKTGNPPPATVHLVAHTLQEKAAWISDISQVKTVTTLTVVMFILRRGKKRPQ